MTIDIKTILGTSYVSGYSGWSGISGYSGTSGYSGYSGISGYSGYSGISGYSGFSGVPSGSNTQVQYNNSGSFGGNSAFTFTAATGTLASTVFQAGAGSVGSPSVIPTGDTNTGVWFPAADTVAVSTGGSERFRVDSSGNMLPGSDATYNFGSPTYRWNNIYTADAHFSNEGTQGNSIDGTTGNWTLQEGQNNIYMINNKTGQKFKLKLEEV